MEETFKKIATNFGQIDILVNSAGIFKDSDIETTLNVNLKGFIESSLLGLSLMTKEGEGNGGFIVNIPSVTGLNPTYVFPIYSATKFGVTAFTRSMGVNIKIFLFLKKWRPFLTDFF